MAAPLLLGLLLWQAARHPGTGWTYYFPANPLVVALLFAALLALWLGPGLMLLRWGYKK
ncbi:hypothetical protein ACXXDK_10400 [Deinococcus sp. PESE-38]